MDRNRDGRISRREFARALEKLRFDLTKKEVRTLHKKFDRDGNGYIKYKDFLKGCRPDGKGRNGKWARRGLSDDDDSGSGSDRGGRRRSSRDRKKKKDRRRGRDSDSDDGSDRYSDSDDEAGFVRDVGKKLRRIFREQASTQRTPKLKAPFVF